MKKWLLYLLMLGWAGMAAQAQTSIVFTWTDTNLSTPSCSATVATACIAGMTLTDTTVAAAPVVITASIAPTASSYTLTPLPAAGSHTYSLVGNGKGPGGRACVVGSGYDDSGRPFRHKPGHWPDSSKFQ